jgi:hypothetical protein
MMLAQVGGTGQKQIGENHWEMNERKQLECRPSVSDVEFSYAAKVSIYITL